jgi:hypothetical protein
MTKSAFSVGALGISMLGLALGAACTPSYDQHSIKTADDRLKEQEQLAYQDEQKARTKPAATGTVEDPDKPGAFDDKQADLEFKRATRSAETCPDVVTGDNVPHGKTTVTVTFALDGSVASATIPPPFEETRLGNCVINAYQALIVPPYSGERKVVSWDVNLEKAKPKPEEKPVKKK